MTDKPSEEEIKWARFLVGKSSHVEEPPTPLKKAGRILDAALRAAQADIAALKERAEKAENKANRKHGYYDCVAKQDANAAVARADEFALKEVKAALSQVEALKAELEKTKAKIKPC